MLPLPTPEKGGRIDELRPLVNMPTENLWVLYIGVLVSYLLPSGPYPVLVICGSQGSAKSTAARFTKRLIDPNKAPLRRPPRSERDL